MLQSKNPKYPLARAQEEGKVMQQLKYYLQMRETCEVYWSYLMPISSWPAESVPVFILWTHIKALLEGRGRGWVFSNKWNRKVILEDMLNLVLMLLIPVPSRYFLYMTGNVGKQRVTWISMWFISWILFSFFPNPLAECTLPLISLNMHHNSYV